MYGPYVRCHGCGRRRASHNVRYCPTCRRVLCHECYVPGAHTEGRCVADEGKEDVWESSKLRAVKVLA